MRKLILNADDFGLSIETVKSTIDAFEIGLLSSATIMANMEATNLAVEFASEHPEYSFGIHLYLTDEFPVTDIKAIRSLIDQDTGKLWETKMFIKRLFTGKIRYAEIRTEIDSQIKKLRSLDLKISHIDGHSHIHKFPIVLSAVCENMQKHKIFKIRRPQNLYFRKTHGKIAKALNKIHSLNFTRKRLSMPKYFLMTSGRTDCSYWLKESIQRLPPGVTEIGIHPGQSERWRKFESDSLRQIDLGFLDENQITLVNYNEI